jgi:predicted ester cyclase
MWAAGDYVVFTGTLSGTNTGDMPSAGIKKTGKKVNVHFCEIVKFEGGKQVEDYLFFNGAAFAAQLGLK